MAIYKCSWEVEQGTDQEQIQRVVRAGLPYNPELRADKRVIFTLARFPQGCQKKLKKMPLLFTFLLFSTFHDGTRGIKQSSLLFNYVKFSKSHFELIVRSDARNRLAMSSGTAIELSENKFESLFAGADN